LCDGAQMAILATVLRPVFAARREQHISGMHSKFTLGHAMCRSRPIVDVQSVAAEIRRGKDRKIEERNHRAKI